MTTKRTTEDQWIKNLDVESLEQLQADPLALLQLELEAAPPRYMHGERLRNPRPKKKANRKKRSDEPEDKPVILKNEKVEGNRVIYRIQTTDSAVDSKITAIVFREIHLIVCTRDRKYSGVRKKLNAAGKDSEKLILTTISAALGAKFGLEFAVVANVVLTMLMMLLKVGKEVFCSLSKRMLPAS